MNKDNRRSFLKNASLLTFGGLLATSALDTFAEEKANKNIRRAIRIAHITDVHLLDTPMPKEAFRRVIQAINTMKDKPALIINSGDSVMDMNNQGKAHVESLWAAWREIIATNKLPLKSCIGNHDVWYAPKAEADTVKDDPLYGKKMTIKELNMPSAYYSFSQNGWKFIALDSINHNKDVSGYALGEEQFAWLKNELEQTDAATNVLIFSHVPIMTVTGIMYEAQRRAASKGYSLGDQHVDVKQIKDLFYAHKNVKLALSGHMHYIDDIDYLGVKYHCGGAVSGNWWGGVLDEFPPAYTIIDLYEDGSSQREMIYYNWQ
jgi:Icc protein